MTNLLFLIFVIYLFVTGITFFINLHEESEIDETFARAIFWPVLVLFLTIVGLGKETIRIFTK